jgi:hypothetical protein
MGRKITRRGLIQSAGILGGLGALAGSTSGLGPEAFAQAAGSTAQSGIEPNTIKRRGGWLPRLRSGPRFPRFHAVCPVNSEQQDRVPDRYTSNLVHTWEMPYPPGLYGYLTDRGTLFYNGKIPSSTHVGQAPYAGGAALEVDWKGRVLWEVRHPDHNHDGRRLRNGNVILICAKPLPDEIARRVRGGRPGSEYDGSKMDAPYLVEITTAGEIMLEWRSWDHLDPEKDGITAVQDDRDVWTVANAAYELPDGNIMVSFRAISTVVMINRQTGEIYWRLGAPPLSGQHAPNILANGHLLLFDNGPHRLDETLPFSRVLEIDVVTKRIVWKYQDSPVSNFFSPRISNAQRLPNGNTLIDEGWFGRFFEVTPEGETVWEYVNPYFGASEGQFGPSAGPTVGGKGPQVNRVFRAYRYTEAEIARAQAAT